MKLKLNEETQGGKDGISLGPELRKLRLAHPINDKYVLHNLVVLSSKDGFLRI